MSARSDRGRGAGWSLLTPRERRRELFRRTQVDDPLSVVLSIIESASEPNADDNPEDAPLILAVRSAWMSRLIATMHGVSRQSILAGNSCTEAVMSATIPEIAIGLSLPPIKGRLPLLL